jgi:hypothetical protein
LDYSIFYIFVIITILEMLNSILAGFKIFGVVGRPGNWERSMGGSRELAVPRAVGQGRGGGMDCHDARWWAAVAHGARTYLPFADGS